MGEDFSFDVPKMSSKNPLTARATVVDRSEAPAAIPYDATSPQVQTAKMGPPPSKRRGKIPLEKGYSQMDWMRLQHSKQDLSGLKGGRLRKDITMEEVKQHNSEGDMWTVLRGRVYNITAYLNFHPGGAAQLKRGAGIDSTALFMKYHAWVNAEMMLEKCLIGVLARESDG